MRDQIIRLEVSDTLDSARDRIKWLRAEHVLLVFPDDPRQPILRRPLDLVVLKRIVSQRDAELTIISTDAVVIDNAQEIGLRVFPSLAAYQKRYLSRQVREVATIDDEPNPDGFESETDASEEDLTTPEAAIAIDISSVSTGDSGVEPDRQRGQSSRAVWYLATIGILSLGLAIVVVPFAQVTIVPETRALDESIQVRSELGAQIDNDAEVIIIPARQIVFEVSGSLTTEPAGVEVREADLLRLQAELEESLIEEALDQIVDDPESLLLTTELVITESLRVAGVVQQEFSAEVGDEVNELSLNLTLQFAAIAVDQRPAREIAYSLLVAEVGSLETLNPDTIVFRQDNLVYAAQAETVTFDLTVTAAAVANSDVDGLSNQLVGRYPSVASEFIENQLTLSEAPSIEVRPSLMPLMPLLPNRIEFVVENG